MSHDRPETPDNPARGREQSDLLAEAYAERTQQLHDARVALAESVATLRAELTERRAEAAAQREESAALRRTLDAAELRNQALEVELERMQAELARMQAELQRRDEVVSTLRNMKVVRWTAGPRGVVYRLRDRLR